MDSFKQYTKASRKNGSLRLFTASDIEKEAIFCNCYFTILYAKPQPTHPRYPIKIGKDVRAKKIQ